MPRYRYSLLEEPVGTVYFSLVRFLGEHATRFAFIVRERGAALLERVLRELEPDLVGVRSVTAWPGSELLGDRSAQAHVYAMTQGSIHVLSRAASALFDWQHPELPEDPSFLRSDGTVLMQTLSYDFEAQFVLDDAELAALRSIHRLEIELLNPDDFAGGVLPDTDRAWFQDITSSKQGDSP